MIPFFKTVNFTEREILYDGTQLSPHWIYKNLNLVGDTVVAFQGAANVTLDHMVDLEDVKKKAPIASQKMLHFLGEFFIESIEIGILLQHLFINQIYESLWEQQVTKLNRQGNDIYYDARKLSVSICTKSTLSVLIHIGINITNTGTPIPTSCLRELGIDATQFGATILQKLSKESETWRMARSKVIAR